jgi:hypothetical protein
MGAGKYAGILQAGAEKKTATFSIFAIWKILSDDFSNCGTIARSIFANDRSQMQQVRRRHASRASHVDRAREWLEARREYLRSLLA